VNNNSNTIIKQDFAVVQQVDGRVAQMTDTTWHQSWQSNPPPLPDHDGSIPEKYDRKAFRRHLHFIYILLHWLQSILWQYLSTLNSLNFCTSEFSSKSSNLVQPTPQPQTLVIGATDYREQHVSSGVVQENAVAYVAGYLLNKCFNIHDCSNM
jgi:predicted KAP-like P-loop ATPase